MANFRSRERMAGSPQARTERVLPPPLDGPPDMAVFGPMAIRGLVTSLLVGEGHRALGRSIGP